jgi:hypothetical protein
MAVSRTTLSFAPDVLRYLKRKAKKSKMSLSAFISTYASELKRKEEGKKLTEAYNKLAEDKEYQKESAIWAEQGSRMLAQLNKDDPYY